MTPADQRAYGLLNKYRSARANPKGFWTCGPERIAQTTVLRLLKRGVIKRDPQDPDRRVLAMEAESEEAEDTEDIQGALGWAENKVGPDGDEEDPLEYRPPDYRDQFDRPVELDQALEDTDDQEFG